MVKGKRIWRAGAIVLAGALLTGAGSAWWHAAHWEPADDSYPVQGAWVDERHDARAVLALAEGGEGGTPLVRFVYATASSGASGRNDRFAEERERAGRSGLPFGAVHVFDPCVPADRQSANFVTLVPRDRTLLPPAVQLNALGEDCPRPVRAAEVESELVTFLNQIEAHAGRRAVLAPSEAFEAAYGFGARSKRALWLGQDREEPAYAGGDWAIWTANSALRLDQLEEPVGWLVMRHEPGGETG